MSTLIVEGGHRLGGSVTIEGNKNAALPLLAACLLTDEPCMLSNVPRIGDVRVMAELLGGLGAEVEGIGTTTMRIRCAGIRTGEPDPRLVGRLRGSVLLVGPLLARLGRATLAPPGGDFPGRRTLAAHLQALRAMGVRVEAGERHAFAAPDGLTPASFYLEEASVTGTETAILAAAAAPGRSEIRHAACEPHVVELCAFLRGMGVEIEGAGTPTIRITGGARLRGTAHRLRGDYIEAGSWAVVAAITGGEVEVRGVAGSDIEPLTTVLGRMRVDCEVAGERFVVRPSQPRACARSPPPRGPIPQRHGESGHRPGDAGGRRTLIHDWMYELRPLRWSS